jgi:serine/threonine protein kinase
MDNIKVVDFGLSSVKKAGSEGVAGFTPGYAAPEVICDSIKPTGDMHASHHCYLHDRAFDQMQSDVFSFGVLLWELAAGRFLRDPGLCSWSVGDDHLRSLDYVEELWGADGKDGHRPWCPDAPIKGRYPDGLRSGIKQLLQDCWRCRGPPQRPNFTIISEKGERASEKTISEKLDELLPGGMVEREQGRMAQNFLATLLNSAEPEVRPR